jgi:hypothetical protein
MPSGAAIVVKDTATPALRDLRGLIAPQRLAAVAGRAGQECVRNHLFGLDSSRPNSLGGRRTHFYADAARSTHWRVDEGAVLVSISHVGIAQRFFGGEIRPVNRRLLTIPAAPEAHGRRAGEFDDLAIIFRMRNGSRVPIGLARRAQQLISIEKRKGKLKVRRGREIKAGERVLYWLVERAEQRPDPTVLPDDATLASAIDGHLASYIDRNVALFDRQGGAQ